MKANNLLVHLLYQIKRDKTQENLVWLKVQFEITLYSI